LEFLLDAKNSGKKVWGYGAAAKGNTLLNYAGIRSDLIGGVCVIAHHINKDVFCPAAAYQFLIEPNLARRDRTTCWSCLGTW
jgi:hypothetical protein